MSQSTAVIVLHAADNLFAQLQAVHASSVASAERYHAFKSQRTNVRALQGRVGGPSSASRERTLARLDAKLVDALRDMQRDLESMMLIVDQLKVLPVSTLGQHDIDRLSTFINAHSDHLRTKQGLFTLCAAALQDNATSPSTSWDQDDQLLKAWKALPEFKEAQTAELDDLAKALGGF